MAVSKTITYVDTSNALKTATVSIDIQKLAIGDTSDEERVFLVISAPGIATQNYWRKDIEGLVEDGIFAASGVDDYSTRYTHPSGAYTAFGDKIANSGIVDGASGIVGVRQQLIDLAG